MILKPWLNYKTKKANKSNKGLRESVSYRSTKRIGIIFCNDEQKKLNDVDKLSDLLKKDGKKVKIIAQENKSGFKHLPYDTFNDDDFSFWGKFIGKPINDFVTTDYDFLICLDDQPNHMISSILANSQAKCRIGKFEESNESIFEMMLENTANNNHDWVDSIYEYIKIIS
jgi:Family of unknown function (DUF6913)